MAYKKWLFILGPTAIGKHRTAIQVAKTLNSELISVDSMKVYREMDIGAAKPSKENLEQVRHYLMDILDPQDSYNAGQFVRDAQDIARDIETRNKLPIFVGGTALYYKVLAYGIFKGIPRDNAIRNELLETAKEKGSVYLHSELAKVDPAVAKKIHPNDLKRIIRALEVYRKVGIPISTLQIHFAKAKSENVVVCLRCEKDILKKRIEERAEKMFEMGLVEEVVQLKNREKGWSKEAQSGVGYKEVIEYLDGKYNLEETKCRVKINTMHFAKKQMTWFKSFKEVEWLDVNEKDAPEDIAKKIVTLYNKHL